MNKKLITLKRKEKLKKKKIALTYKDKWALLKCELHKEELSTRKFLAHSEKKGDHMECISYEKELGALQWLSLQIDSIEEKGMII